MSILTTYLQKEQQLKQLQEELKQLESNEGFKADLEFKSQLEDLMKQYEKSAADVLSLLNPTPGAATSKDGGGQRKRKLRIYKNPTTGEVVEARSGNQKTLKAWKAEFGEEAVESWLVRVES